MITENSESVAKSSLRDKENQKISPSEKGYHIKHYILLERKNYPGTSNGSCTIKFKEMNFQFQVPNSSHVCMWISEMLEGTHL